MCIHIESDLIQDGVGSRLQVDHVRVFSMQQAFQVASAWQIDLLHSAGRDLAPPQISSLVVRWLQLHWAILRCHVELAGLLVPQHNPSCAVLRGLHGQGTSSWRACALALPARRLSANALRHARSPALVESGGG